MGDSIIGLYFMLLLVIFMGVMFIMFPQFFHDLSESRRTRGSLFGRLLDLEPRPFTDGYKWLYRIMGGMMIIGSVLAANFIAYG